MRGILAWLTRQIEGEGEPQKTIEDRKVTPEKKQELVVMPASQMTKMQVADLYRNLGTDLSVLHEELHGDNIRGFLKRLATTNSNLEKTINELLEEIHGKVTPQVASIQMQLKEIKAQKDGIIKEKATVSIELQLRYVELERLLDAAKEKLIETLNKIRLRVAVLEQVAASINEIFQHQKNTRDKIATALTAQEQFENRRRQVYGVLEKAARSSMEVAFLDVTIATASPELMRLIAEIESGIQEIPTITTQLLDAQHDVLAEVEDTAEGMHRTQTTNEMVASMQTKTEEGGDQLLIPPPLSVDEIIREIGKKLDAMTTKDSGRKNGIQMEAKEGNRKITAIENILQNAGGIMSAAVEKLIADRISEDTWTSAELLTLSKKFGKANVVALAIIAKEHTPEEALEALIPVDTLSGLKIVLGICHHPNVSPETAKKVLGKAMNMPNYNLMDKLKHLGGAIAKAGIPLSTFAESQNLKNISFIKNYLRMGEKVKTITSADLEWILDHWPREGGSNDDIKKIQLMIAKWEEMSDTVAEKIMNAFYGEARLELLKNPHLSCAMLDKYQSTTTDDEADAIAVNPSANERHLLNIASTCSVFGQMAILRHRAANTYVLEYLASNALENPTKEAAAKQLKAMQLN